MAQELSRDTCCLDLETNPFRPMRFSITVTRTETRRHTFEVVVQTHSHESVNYASPGDLNRARAAAIQMAYDHDFMEDPCDSCPTYDTDDERVLVVTEDDKEKLN